MLLNIHSRKFRHSSRNNTASRSFSCQSHQREETTDEKAFLRSRRVSNPRRCGPLQSQALRDLVYGSAATETTIATATITVRGLGSMDMTVAGIADGIIAMVTVT